MAFYLARRWLLLAIAAAACTGCDSFVYRFGPYPGRQIPAVFRNGPVRLHGQLLLPHGHGPFPAIVLVHGSGAWVFKGNVAWKAHARAFQQHGFAVLVYDKRGAGSSTGNLAAADFEDLASDVVAAVAWLRARPEVRKDAIGLFGFSEGGWVSVLGAHRLEQKGARPAFLITTSGPAVTPAVQEQYENTMRLREAGTADSAIANANRRLEQKWQEDSRAFGDHTRARETRVRSFDPVPLLRTLPCALLAVYGADDDVVNAQESAEILNGMRASDQRAITVRVFEGVGHSLVQKDRLIPRYAPGYLELVGAWARQHAR